MHSYAIGLLFISPLGDILRPRQLMLLLITLSTLVTLAILLTPAFTPFLVFSFLLGPVSVTPQILLPLAADLAPPARRGTAIAICISGLMLGVLVARVLAGLVAEYAPWRTIYYVALGFQFLVLASLYSLLPDYPPRNPQLTYFKMLGSIAKFAVTEPVLIQASLINFAGVACFANFWVTSTFLLGGAPFNFST
jgi:predicted MFS family arabinose efflux permease